jgi:hypothetical protein
VLAQLYSKRNNLRAFAPLAVGFLLMLAPRARADRYGADFLRLEPGAASIARGGCGLLLRDPGFAAWWNPALLAEQERRLVAFQHADRFEGLLSQDVLALDLDVKALGSKSSEKQKLSFYLLRQAIEDIPLSTELEGGDSFENGGVPRVSEWATASDWVLGCGMGQALPALWNQKIKANVGVSAKLIHRDMLVVKAWGLSVDAGLEVLLPHDLRLAAVLKDVTGALLVWDDGEKEWLPPEWALGAAWTKTLSSQAIAFSAAFELRGDTQGQVADANGDFRFADSRVGFETRFFDTLALRMGWYDDRVSAGAGLGVGRLQADYAWRPHHDLGSSHLFSFSLNF